MPTFGTLVDPGAFVEITDPLRPGQKKRPGAGFTILVRDYFTKAALPSVTTTDGGYFLYSTTDALAVEYSTDSGATYRPLIAFEALLRTATDATLPPIPPGVYTKEEADSIFATAGHNHSSYATKTYVTNALNTFDPGSGGSPVDVDAEAAGALSDPTSTTRVAADSIYGDESHRHGILTERFYHARGGTLGTSGLGAVAVRVDDWPNQLNNGMQAAHVEFNIPMTRALCSARTGDGTVNWSGINTLGLTDGFEVASHSTTHFNAETYAGLRSEIVDSRASLEALLPALNVDQFIMPGATGPDGTSGTRYGGYNGYDPAQWHETPGGRMTLNTYALSSGYIAPFLHPLSGRIVQGNQHYTIEDRTLTEIVTKIKQAQATGTALTLMSHPSNVGDPGKLSTADYRLVMQYLATERDAGRLVVLTMSGIAMADASHSRRQSLLANGFTGQTATDGWVADGFSVRDSPTQNVVAAASASTTGATLTQTVDLNDSFAWAKGTTYELVADLWAYTGGAETSVGIRVRVNDTVIDRTYTVPMNLTAPVKVVMPHVIDKRRSTHKVEFSTPVDAGRVYIKNVALRAV